jgi:hypothetical protein
MLVLFVADIDVVKGTLGTHACTTCKLYTLSDARYDLLFGTRLSLSHVACKCFLIDDAVDLSVGEAYQALEVTCRY